MKFYDETEQDRINETIDSVGSVATDQEEMDAAMIRQQKSQGW